MKKYTDIAKEGHKLNYDLSNSFILLEEAIDKINEFKEKVKDSKIDTKDLEEGWQLIDRYFGNLVRKTNYKNRNKRNKDEYIPNTSANVPDKGDN